MILGYIFAVFIGFLLGIMGGGGSILIIPVFIYLLKMDPKLSIGLSLGIVGITSFIGVLNHYRKSHVSFKTVVVFAPFTMLGAYLSSYISSFIPGPSQLLFFATVMFACSLMMIQEKQKIEIKKKNPFLIGTIAFVIGIISGIAGVGGGFLIVPSLVILVQLPMKKAVGTSLAVISLSALTAFSNYITQLEIPWLFFISFTVLSGVGISLGSHFVPYISQQKLKKSFGFFLILMSLFILLTTFRTL
ncbi:MAG: sulfite exporter TauE/SafE family protein [Bdellovibrionales bacterium]|nr:sulfite exporter TauE/SafE family protein [Bdellovibrionales bacterium]